MAGKNRTGGKHRLRKVTKSSSQPPVVQQVLIPPDIITEILSMLPPKAFARFRCLSKSFNSFLTESRLIQNLALHPTQKLEIQKLLFNNDHHTCPPRSLNLEKIDLDHCSLGVYFFEKLDLPYVSSSVASCNGLLIDYYYSGTFILLNPSTGEYRSEARPYGEFFGFGYDLTNEDYKILVGSWSNVEHVDHNICIAKVFSFQNKRWKSINPDPSAKLKPIGEGAVYVCGALHWIALDCCHYHSCRYSYYHDNHGRYYRQYISALGGRLCMTMHHSITKSTDIWVMEKYGDAKSWIKLQTICRYYNSDLKYCLSSICYTKNGCIVCRSPYHLGLDIYDPRNKSWSVLEFPRDLQPMCLRAAYEENFVSLRELLGDQIN
ncbi:hypothetical protein SLEP1_g37707 [Rubroshorea leprosula]|uniref:F-box domain-containing protein n=1 Tax=Rubroshorea leprosula TaxID=152421 RepID=A0AAV5KVI2_9ROSI|nr:hypothetical protein SLEP1_g37707 [Rubroshorea leprosula]